MGFLATDNPYQFGTSNNLWDPPGSTPDPNAPTGDKTRDSILALYKKYGVKAGGPGSGFTDIDYWSTQANNSKDKGWSDYWDNRLGSDLAGTGPDVGGGGKGGGGDPWGGSFHEDPRYGPLFDFLMKRATQSLDISPEDPIIANQVNAYGAQQTRAANNYLDSLAESGGPINNLGSEKRMASENVGQQTGAFEAQLMGRELTARRQEIQDALSQYGSLLSDEQRMQLQYELALIEDAFNRTTLGQRAFEFDENNEFRRSPLAGGAS